MRTSWTHSPRAWPDTGQTAKIKEGELALAVRLIDELSREEFTPEQYQDAYRRRVLEMVNRKAEGTEVPRSDPRSS